MILILLFILLIIIFCIFLLHRTNSRKEGFESYNSDVIDTIVSTINDNTQIMNQNNTFVKQFTNNYYTSDQVDKVISNERADIQLYQKHSYLLDKTYFNINDANDTFLKNNDIDKYYNYAKEVDLQIDVIRNKLDYLYKILENFETKENINGIYVMLSEFDKFKDQFNKYKTNINLIDDAIKDSKFIFETTDKTIKERFEKFYRDLDLVNKQHSYIKSYLMDENNKINTNQVFAFKFELDSLDKTVKNIQEKSFSIDERIDKTEQKLIDMNKQFCLGESNCLEFTDVYNLKEMANIFKSTYKDEKEMMEEIQKDVIEYQSQIEILQSKLKSEIETREKINQQYENDMNAMKTKLETDNSNLSATYQKMINILKREKDELKTELKNFMDVNVSGIEERNTQLDSLNTKIQFLEREINNITQERDSIQKRLNDLFYMYENENGGYKQTLNNKNMEIKQLKTEIDIASDYVAKTNILIEEKNKEITKLNSEINSCTANFKKEKNNNINLTADVKRISELLDTLQSKNIDIQNELDTCKIEKNLRKSQEEYDAINLKYTVCEEQKENDYISKVDLPLSYLLLKDHNRILNDCKNDKTNNYTLNTIVKSDYVLKTEYDQVLNEYFRKM